MTIIQAAIVGKRWNRFARCSSDPYIYSERRLWVRTGVSNAWKLFATSLELAVANEDEEAIEKWERELEEPILAANLEGRDQVCLC